jgi:hypothetical protein
MEKQQSPCLSSIRCGLYQLIFRSNNLKNKRFATAFYAHPLLKYLAEDTWFTSLTTSLPEIFQNRN